MQRSVFLHFDSNLVEKPIISDLVRKYDVEVNILEARITPNEEGSMFIGIQGSDENLDKAFGYLVSSGVKVTVKPRRLLWHEDICTSCGACLAHCLPKALNMDPDTGEVRYDDDLCISCLLCIPACPYRALEEASL